ncbi:MULTISPECIES: hypothetical protein [unclassified Caballeronia]|nr:MULTISPECIES: hypothetical protein [unclassified Caballeronia]MDR5736683.1 hypothetical protein [Caballeronia sp. LZ016]MDR5810836.1 hypothetical protein [Caballeronia sp. LZ019]
MFNDAFQYEIVLFLAGPNIRRFDDSRLCRNASVREKNGVAEMEMLA